MEKTYISVDATAKRQGVHRKTIYDRIKNDPTFPRPFKFSPGCTRFLVSDLEAWEASKLETAGK